MGLEYRLLSAFEQTFSGKRYLHRNSVQGDRVSLYLYEDLLELERPNKLKPRIENRECVVNASNTKHGIRARRGDGTFGERIPNSPFTEETDFKVARGPVATIEIGVEMKILFKAMIKQIDRVCGDLEKQVANFKKGGGNPISVGLVGVNHADRCTSYEGDRTYATNGGGRYKHPIQEAPDAIRRIEANAAPAFDHFLILRFRATNEEPYAFEWLNEEETRKDYAAMLIRIAREYDSRFS